MVLQFDNALHQPQLGRFVWWVIGLRDETQDALNRFLACGTGRQGR